MEAEFNMDVERSKERKLGGGGEERVWVAGEEEGKSQAIQLVRYATKPISVDYK